MKLALTALLALALVACSGSCFAQSSTTTGSAGTGVSISGMTMQDVGGQTITLVIGGGTAKLAKAPSASPAGVTAGTFSAGLSLGAVLGSGFGSTGGTAGSQAGALGSLNLP